MNIVITTPEPQARDWTPPGRRYNPMTRAAFEGMSGSDQGAFIRAGGKVVDEVTPLPVVPERDGNMITRAAFDAMPASERPAFIRAGGSVVDVLPKG